LEQLIGSLPLGEPGAQAPLAFEPDDALFDPYQVALVTLLLQSRLDTMEGAPCLFGHTPPTGKNGYFDAPLGGDFGSFS
jgi:hypothetical protein